MTDDHEHTANELPMTVLYILEKAHELASARAGEPTMPTRADMIEAGEPILRQLFGTEYEKYEGKNQ